MYAPSGTRVCVGTAESVHFRVESMKKRFMKKLGERFENTDPQDGVASMMFLSPSVLAVATKKATVLLYNVPARRGIPEKIMELPWRHASLSVPTLLSLAPSKKESTLLNIHLSLYCVIHSNGNAAVYDVAIAIKNANEKIVQPEHSVSKVGTSSTKLSNAKVSAHSLLCKSSHGLVVFNPSSSAAEGHPRIIQSVGSSFSDFATRSTILKTGAKQVTGKFQKGKINKQAYLQTR